MGRVGSAYDNAMMESFFSTLQRELLHRRSWTTRKAGVGDLRGDEAWYNPRRRHSLIAYHSPLEHERLYTAGRMRHDRQQNKLVRRTGATSPGGAAHTSV